MPIYNYLNHKQSKQKQSWVNTSNLIAIQLTVIIFLVLYNIGGIMLHKKQQTQAHPNRPVIANVQGAHTQLNPVPSAPPALEPVTSYIPSPTQIPQPSPLPKTTCSIAVIGDSMVDTMGERLEYLEHALKKAYPTTEFNLYNYGKGSENVIEGLARIDAAFTYKDRSYPALPVVKPDLIIVGSYAYNPLTPYDRDMHWLKLAELIKKCETITPHVYILTEIAPLREDFGRGPQGINWEESVRVAHSKKITEQLENAIGLSSSLKVPLINTYQASITDEQNTVKREYVNAGDGIHPSVEGHMLTADEIVKTVVFDF